jgi:hypothetical protein
MTQTTGRMTRRVLVSTLSLLFGTAAQAGFYPGHLDPGGNGFDIPGFEADLVYQIPDDCFTSPGAGWKATNQNIGSGGCGDASVVSATVYLYSTSPSDPPSPGIVLDQFNLANWDVLGVYSDNGVIKGIDTNPMGPKPGSSTYDDDMFWLQLVSGFCDTSACDRIPTVSEITETRFLSLIATVEPPSPLGGYLFVNSLDNPSVPGTPTFGPECRTDPNGAPIDCFVTTVPEPGTLALLFGALGGGWLARRRKRNASA